MTKPTRPRPINIDIISNESFALTTTTLAELRTMVAAASVWGHGQGKVFFGTADPPHITVLRNSTPRDQHATNAIAKLLRQTLPHSGNAEWVMSQDTPRSRPRLTITERKPTRGGARAGAGRPSLDPDDPTVTYTIRLPGAIAQALRALGSDPVRAALARLARKRGG